MDELKNKMKRVKPLIRAKQFVLDQEAAALERVRTQKYQIMTELKRYERLYITGVEQLNHERQSSMREKLDVMERSVDHYKSMWYKSLKTMRDIESQERAQLHQLMVARQELMSMESLEERYQAQASKVAKDKEQKNNDEAALRGFNKNRA